MLARTEPKDAYGGELGALRCLSVDAVDHIRRRGSAKIKAGKRGTGCNNEPSSRGLAE